MKGAPHKEILGEWEEAPFCQKNMAIGQSSSRGVLGARGSRRGGILAGERGGRLCCRGTSCAGKSENKKGEDGDSLEQGHLSRG